MASQDDLLNMYLYGGQSPNQVDLMQQLQSMQKPAQVAPQIQQQPLVLLQDFNQLQSQRLRRNHEDK